MTTFSERKALTNHRLTFKKKKKKRKKSKGRKQNVSYIPVMTFPCFAVLCLIVVLVPTFLHIACVICVQRLCPTLGVYVTFRGCVLEVLSMSQYGTNPSKNVPVPVR